MPGSSKKKPYKRGLGDMVGGLTKALLGKKKLCPGCKKRKKNLNTFTNKLRK